MQFTLCLIYEHLPAQAGPQILLGMKKRGFGAGRWNGFGGKVHEGESVEAAAKRELLEEAGITADKLEKRGILGFEFRGKPEILEIHVFRVRGFSGKPEETEEVNPRWFAVNEIPYDAMWPDDKLWLPLFLKGKKFRGKFVFGENDAIFSHELLEVDDL